MDFRLQVVQCCDNCVHLKADKRNRCGICEFHNIVVHKLNVCDDYVTDGDKVARVVNSISKRESDLIE